tara:strand:+ start:52 stop:576 length:525 start_codon:yes stop_codon:yes gene_type:complete
MNFKAFFSLSISKFDLPDLNITMIFNWDKPQDQWLPFPFLRFRLRKGGLLMQEARLSFKEMCERFSVTPRTLRYYEYIELLQPDREGRSRFYGPREIARMTLILRGRKFGFLLEEMRQWLAIYDQEGTKAQMEVFTEMAERKISELREQQVQLAHTLKELEELRDKTIIIAKKN